MVKLPGEIREAMTGRRAKVICVWSSEVLAGLIEAVGPKKRMLPLLALGFT